MLETPQERARLLRTGLSEKKIESLYVQFNSFELVRDNVLRVS